MCGINCTIGFSDASSIERMTAILRHRGPDDQGALLVYENPCVYLGHTRLSVIDVSARGHQPMQNSSKILSISYNGEIYNYKELRRELCASGYSFRTDSDTEVILCAYEEWGDEAFARLDGMFSLVLFDARTACVTVVRDRLGIKPLYMWKGKDRFACSSELKALLVIPEIKKSVTLDTAALTAYGTRLWAPDPKTPFHEIKKLEPGTMVQYKVRTHEVTEKTYWSLNAHRMMYSYDEAAEKLETLLSDSVRKHMIADVTVGTFLSGGLDSSIITALMRKETKGTIHAFTISFSHKDQIAEAMMNDVYYARKVARQYDCTLHEIEISAQVTKNNLKKIIYHLDEPIGDPAAINTYLIARMAKEVGVTVLLSGQGSDELFGGYRKYLAALWLEKMWKNIPVCMHAPLERFVENLPVTCGRYGLRYNRWLKRLITKSQKDPFSLYDGLSSFVNRQEREGIFVPAIARQSSVVGHETYFNALGPSESFLTRMCYADTKLFLPGLNLLYSDKATMAAGIECRVPFVDPYLAQFAMSLPDHLRIKGNTQKYILKKVSEKWLPRDVVYRPKMPFSSPIRSWVKNDFRELIGDYLSPARLKQQGIFNPEGIVRMIDEDRRGKRDHAHLLYGLLTIQIWLEVFDL